MGWLRPGDTDHLIATFGWLRPPVPGLLADTTLVTKLLEATAQTSLVDATAGAKLDDATGRLILPDTTAGTKLVGEDD